MSPLGVLERSFLLCILRMGDDRALAALSTPERARVDAAVAAQRALARPERAVAMAGLLQSLGAPLPAGLDRIHPSWIAEILADEPAEVAALLLAEAPAALQGAIFASMAGPRASELRSAPRIAPSADVRGWLRRRTLGQLVPMTPLAGTPAELAVLLTLPSAELAETLAARARAVAGMDGATYSIAPLDAMSAGLAARALAPLFAKGPREVRSQLAQRLPVALGRGLLAQPFDVDLLT